MCLICLSHSLSVTGPGRVALSHSSFDRDEELDEFQFYSDGNIHDNIIMVKSQHMILL